MVKAQGGYTKYYGALADAAGALADGAAALRALRARVEGGLLDQNHYFAFYARIFEFWPPPADGASLQRRGCGESV